MWTRSIIKQRARDNLRGSYWSAFAVSLIAGILGGSFSASSSGSGFRIRMGEHGNAFSDVNLLIAALPITLLLIFIGLAFVIFVGYPVQVGGNRWFSRNREAPATPSIGMMFSLFSGSEYPGAVGGMLWMNLFLFLWGLLAAVPALAAGIFLLGNEALAMLWSEFLSTWDIGNINNWLSRLWTGRMLELNLIILASVLLAIPAIVKSYSYRMTPWILADNPKIGFRRALRLSMTLARGHKGAMFVLDLSFIGWMLLGLLACGVGVLFVAPYIQATYAELYAVLRQNGVMNGQCSMEELGFIAT